MVAPKKTISVKTIGVASSGFNKYGRGHKNCSKEMWLVPERWRYFSNMIQYFITSGATAFTLD